MARRKSASYSPPGGGEKFLAATVALGWNAPVTERCRLAGLREKTVRGWLRDKKFLRWIESHYWASMSGEVLSVWAAVLAKAKEGSMRAAHMIFQRFDSEYVPSERQGRLRDKAARREAVKRLLELAEENGFSAKA